tara:strand:+ start:315 stop:2225 length:1911 start_codon:yes stop_codon:yes gene_type:complete
MVNKKNIILLVLSIFIFFIFQIKSSKIIVENVTSGYDIKCIYCIEINNSVFSIKDTYSIKVYAEGFEDGKFKLSHKNGLNIINLEPSEIKVEILYDIPPTNPNFKINNNNYEIGSEVKIKPGEYIFLIESDNYFTYEKIDKILPSGDTYKIDLKKNKINKPIKIVSEYKNVKINNNKYDNIEDIIYLKEKNNNFLFVDNDNLKIDYNYYVDDNRYEEVDFSKIPITIESKILIETNPPGAAISINKKYVGITPITINNKKVNLIEISASGYKDLTIEPNEDLDKKNYLYTLEPLLSKISLKSNLEAKIYINNEYVGITPFEIKLRMGEYDLVLIKDGYAKVEKKLIIDPGFNIDINEKLITLKQSAILNSKQIIENKIGMELKLFNPTQILLGSKITEKRRQRNEILKNVHLNKHYYASKSLVTESNYKSIITSYNKVSENPIVNVTWDEAAIFCNKLSKIEGFEEFYKLDSNEKVVGYNQKSIGYRLLSETEWENIASINTGKTIYPWGDEASVPTGIGNLAGEEVKGKYKYYIKNYRDDNIKLSKVKTFKPNKNGMYDIVGNVSEWVHDFYSEDFFISEDEILYNYMGPNFGNSHVIKGSNYQSSNTTELGISYREGQIEASDLIGFRVARWIY